MGGGLMPEYEPSRPFRVCIRNASAASPERDNAVTRRYGALDAGLAVDPALIENQIVGQMVQSTSRILKEEVTFDEHGVTSLDWASYPILRFAEHPDVVPIVVQHSTNLRPAPARRLWERPLPPSQMPSSMRPAYACANTR